MALRSAIDLNVFGSVATTNLSVWNYINHCSVKIVEKVNTANWNVRDWIFLTLCR